MKKIISLLVTASLSVVLFTVNAQEKRGQDSQRPSPEQMIKYRAQKVAVELSLDDKTSAKFVGVYEKYMTEKMAIRNEFKSQRPQSMPKGTPRIMNDETASKSVDASMDRRQSNIDKEQKLLDLDKKYRTEFEKILNAKQVKKLYEMTNSRPPHHAGGQRNKPTK